tara:strand:- start:3521 stop:3778 length:258 start_codon:yes stop_codon:yes gene_type:complete
MMKKLLIPILLSLSLHSYSDEELTVSNLTVEQLTEIVRTIIQESLQKCSVTGTMKGRAKVNLAVVGSVEANMQCDFDEEPEKVED